MGSRASGAQNTVAVSPRSEGEAKAERTQKVPNSSYEKKKKQKSPRAGVSSLSEAGCVPRCRSSRCCRVPLPLALNNNNNYKGRRFFGAGMA